MRTIDKARSQKQMSYFRATRERRARIATEFRAKLLAELNGAPLTASRTAMVESAVSAHVQVTELTAMFVKGHATPERVRQLSLARGQLQRCLRSLGLIERDEEHEEPESITEILAQEGIANGSR